MLSEFHQKPTRGYDDTEGLLCSKKVLEFCNNELIAVIDLSGFVYAN